MGKGEVVLGLVGVLESVEVVGGYCRLLGRSWRCGLG